jgi:RHS repeat-associated protein
MANGNDGIGHLTSEAFASGPSQSITGSYAYTYDARGQQTGWAMTINSTTYPFTMGYNDAGQQTSLTYPDGDTLTTSYSAQDWLAGATEKLGSTTTTLLNSIGYSGEAGAAHLMTSGSVGNSTYTWALSYDTLNRLDETKVTASSTTLFDQTRSFDAVGNVWNTLTTLPAGTDTQAFCYDDLNRLTWAGASGTPPCQGLTEGTLTSAAYQSSFGYDTNWRLASGPAGSTYTYGDSAHPHGVTSTSGGYTAAYDAAGDMTCRAPNSSLMCNDTPTGQSLGYDAMRRQISWQDATNSPTTTAAYAYNRNGERVEQQVTSGGTTTTTLYIGAYEEIAITGSQTTTTKYYQAGTLTVESVNGTLYYLVGDNLGSVSVTLTSGGSVQATALYAPYGAVRYSQGAMPTSYGFTHQRLDGSGLNYFHSRYYDSGVGLFISSDDVQGPNRYAYTGDNPETRTDPSGHCWPFCAIIGAVVGAVVGVAATVAQSIQTGQPPSFGEVAANIVLGATAGAAIALNPGTAVSGGFALAASLLADPHHNIEAAFRTAAIATDAAFLGGAASDAIESGLKATQVPGLQSLVSQGIARPVAQFFAQGTIAAASDALDQQATGHNINWLEVGIIGGIGGAILGGVQNGNQIPGGLRGWPLLAAQEDRSFAIGAASIAQTIANTASAAVTSSPDHLGLNIFAEGRSRTTEE